MLAELDTVSSKKLYCCQLFKFTFKSTTTEAISGLTLTSANYEEVVATLKNTFGNNQFIVNRHMDVLIKLNHEV